MAEQYKRHSNCKCYHCGKKIYRRPCEIKRGRVFCGQECYGIANRKECPCVVCGKPIMSSLNKKTCSRACANTNRSGTKYQGVRLRDKVKTYYILKSRLSIERGKVCERCGYAKYPILQVHHKNKNRNDNSLSNLELICPNCHFEEHYLGRVAK